MAVVKTYSKGQIALPKENRGSLYPLLLSAIMRESGPSRTILLSF